MRSGFVALTGFISFAFVNPELIKRHPNSPSRKDEFTLAMAVNGTYIALEAVSNGTEDMVLMAQLLAHSPGTPAFLNITNDTSDNFSADSAYSTALVLDLRNSTNYARGTYGLAVPPVGDGHGTSKTVLAVLDYQEFDFAIQDAKVLHGTTAASQSWFSCADTVNGTQGYFLRWGVFTSGGAAPDGCGVTDVVQSFNLPARVPSETDGGREAPGEE